MPAVLIAALSSGHKIGLLTVGLVFIAFALISSFVAPRYRPDFPGKGLSVFIVSCFVLFALMLGAVVIFGVEPKEHTANAAEVGKAAPQKTLQAVETEYRIQLPSSTPKTLVAGKYTFQVVNKGKIPHNLTIAGPGVQNAHTANLGPGQSANLRVQLRAGTYDVYCSIPGHKQLGMDAKLAVG
jgi:uncharacterized cupredoxin-like copper-binding protein